MNAKSTRGIYHDLLGIYAKLNAQYFDYEINASISWGRHGKGAARSSGSIRLGSYDPQKKLIVIHPALDQASVPRLCIERVVYHEMLHQKHPAKRGQKGRRRVHTPEFAAEEKVFLGGEIADAWFRSNLERILRFRAEQSSKYFRS